MTTSLSVIALSVKSSKQYTLWILFLCGTSFMVMKFRKLLLPVSLWGSDCERVVVYLQVHKLVLMAEFYIYIYIYIYIYVKFIVCVCIYIYIHYI